MPVIAVVLAAFAALLHAGFFVLESILWTRPAVWRRFWLRNQEEAELTRPLAYNQGFYNLFLAVGVVVGLALLSSHREAGRAIVLFGCGSMALAALVLLSTGRDKARAAAIQFLPPAIAVVLTVVS